MNHTFPRLSPVLRITQLTVAALALAALGCGDDGEVVSHSQPVGINLKVKADDAAKTNTAQADKSINTESGNPYGAFIQAARAHLGGVDPARIEVASVRLLLGAGSKGVTGLEQALAGTVEILFVMNDTNNTFKVAEAKDPKGTGPVSMALSFEPGMVLGDDYAKLVGGNFKVVLRAAAAAGFAGKNDTEADLQVTLEFVALK